MFDLFGAEMPLAVRFFLAFLIVLGLIGAAAWAVRRFGSARLGGAVRGRQPRLAVIDYASVDARRRLILVRRDNVEHLVMIGGPTDVVVESNIVRAVPASSREPAIPRSPAPAEPLPRTLPLPEAASNGSWPLQPEPPAPPRRAPRIDAFPEEHGGVPPLHTEPHPQHGETPPRPQREALNALAEDIASHPVPPPPAVNPIPSRLRPAVPPRPQPAEPRADVRFEPRAEPRVQAPPVASEHSAADQSLAEMAQRLEAALRKPKAATPAPALEEFDEAELSAPPPPLPPRAVRPAPNEARPARAEPKAREGARENAKENVAQGKALYDSLVQEMASLLGRPAGKT